MIQPVIHSIDSDRTFATWDRVLIQVWRGPVTIRSIRELEHVARQLTSGAAGAKVCSISIVEATSPPPADEARRQLSVFYRDLIPVMQEALVVAIGGGFRGALVRGVGIALSTLSPKTLPFRFVDSIPTAVELVSKHLTPGAGGPSALSEALQAVSEKQPTA